jgi:prepilin-type N-terminal cleavage/methylation domain-containing protein
MKMNFKKGFTLIELLVVVAIIGILASVVLASLNTARSKGSDAAIKANLDSIRAQAAIYYDGTGNQSYGTSDVAVGVCPASGNTSAAAGSVLYDPTVIAAVTQAGLAAGGTITGTTAATISLTSCQSQKSATGPAGYAIAVTEKSDNTKAWCIDGNGNSKEETGLTANTPAGAYTAATSSTTPVCK